jgi:AmiR/NasT family two-component response regulator
MERNRILVVEDERIVAEDLRYTLEHVGYDVVGLVSSGEKAIEKAGELLPDLVLMDVNLDGEMDGIAAADIIRTRHGTPVIYLTAFSNTQTLSRARDTDAFGYIVKPFQEKGVIAAIEMALGKKAKERATRRREEMLRSGLMSLPLGVIMTDERGNIVFANATARHHMGRAFEVEGRVPLGDVFSPAQENADATDNDGSATAPADARGTILQMTGRRLEVLYSEEILRGDDGRELGRIILYQDAEHPPIDGELGRVLRAFLQETRTLPNNPAKYVTICAWSKRVKVDLTHWVSFEEFLTHYVGLNVTHGMSPDVARTWAAEAAAQTEEANG